MTRKIWALMGLLLAGSTLAFYFWKKPVRVVSGMYGTLSAHEIAGDCRLEVISPARGNLRLDAEPAEACDFATPEHLQILAQLAQAILAKTTRPLPEEVLIQIPFYQSPLLLDHWASFLKSGKRTARPTPTTVRQWMAHAKIQSALDEFLGTLSLKFSRFDIEKLSYDLVNDQSVPIPYVTTLIAQSFGSPK